MATALLKSAYEIAREERIKRNAQVMESLGLNAGGGNEEQQEETAAPKAKSPKPKLEPTRQSKRVRGLGPDGTKVEEKLKVEEEEEEQIDNDAMNRRIERLKSLHKERNSAYKNPTATYEHTWMRVRTLTDKALLNRIKVIESRAGQHCLVKMRMFAEVLLLADKEELGKAASEALDRLLTEAGDGSEDKVVDLSEEAT